MKFKELHESLINEITDEQYNKIKSKDRIHMSKSSVLKPYSIPPNKQPQDFKPKGIWYGIGTDWIDWTRSEMPHWEQENLFKLDINTSNVKLIKTMDDIVEFEKEYGMKDGYNKGSIDWNKVAKQYTGIEFYPYLYAARFKHLWYYSIDVDSGCIWDKSAIKRITKL
jgi:hypothetical protein